MYRVAQAKRPQDLAGFNVWHAPSEVTPEEERKANRDSETREVTRR